MRCKNCHYSLQNLRGPDYRCPECGREFDPDDWSSFDYSSPKEPFEWKPFLVFVVVALLASAGVNIHRAVADVQAGMSLNDAVFLCALNTVWIGLVCLFFALSAFVLIRAVLRAIARRS